jgi:cytochrome c551/c552
MEMRVVLLLSAAAALAMGAEEPRRSYAPAFQTSDRCLACHNGLMTPSGQDVSIGYDWRASMMANSSRDPYWIASVRRESIDHPESKADIEDECSVCHMPITRHEAKTRGQKGRIFAHLDLNADDKMRRPAEDGVSCSVCHQIGSEGLGKPQSFNGGFVVDPPDARDNRPEYGPFEIERGQTRIMRSSSEGYRPIKADHIRQSELCATCHTLYTKALGPGGKVVGELPEQMPYQEWLHSEYRNTKSCQNCHMPTIQEEVPIARVLGVPREGAARHIFVAANFFMQRMLNRFRDDLRVKALSSEMAAAAERTVQYLQSQAARVAVEKVEVAGGRVLADVAVENLGGHKLPTAYPSRRAWLHLVVREGGRTVFESGALNPDGSIRGNDNDADAARFEPHYTEIRESDQVQIYEAIAGDSNGGVTTGLLTAVRYLKDNRLLPHGFDKGSAEKEIAVVGEAAGDDSFTGTGDRVRYSIPVTGPGPFEVEAELLYQPIGYRWANNLKRYDTMETARFNRYYDAMSTGSAVRLAGSRAYSLPAASR